MRFLGEQIVPHDAENGPEGPGREPMHQRHDGVKLDREPAVRRRDEESLATDTPQLTKERTLVCPRSDVLNDGAGMRKVERSVRIR